MANCLLSERLVEAAARELLPGCQSKMGYLIASDSFWLHLVFREEIAKVKLPKNRLILSLDEFLEWLKGELPSEWFPAKSSVEAIDFDLTG